MKGKLAYDLSGPCHAERFDDVGSETALEEIHLDNDGLPLLQILYLCSQLLHSGCPRSVVGVEEIDGLVKVGIISRAIASDKTICHATRHTMLTNSTKRYDSGRSEGSVDWKGRTYKEGRKGVLKRYSVPSPTRRGGEKSEGQLIPRAQDNGPTGLRLEEEIQQGLFLLSHALDR
jgi:hypothetical protein